ncbi:hypothetical protein BSL78_14839 [Apostichopus japonicus]|uniref:EF-hand domain-containing protein n=1 Tax=Stichopus japonicus TaxID=307972 RepID=A0A2G8KK12_STIJA|nr:hypothetical protein BSL78_14839 [Apostichopus japonicus]
MPRFASASVEMDSLLPQLDRQSKPHRDKEANPPSFDSICSKLPLILQREDDRADRRQTWTRETKRPRLHPSYSKSNVRRKMDSVQISDELSPMPYQAQLFRSSTSLKMVPLKKYHHMPSFSQPLPDQVTKTKSVPFHSRSRFLAEDHSSSILDWQGYYSTGDPEESEMKRNSAGTLESEYRDLHVGGRPSNLMERDDSSMWASKTNVNLPRKKAKIRPSPEMETQQQPRPTSESDRVNRDNAVSSFSKKDSKTFKSLSLEEMSIRRQMTKTKPVKRRENDPRRSDHLADKVNKKRMQPLVTETSHKLERVHSFPSKRAMVSTDGQKGSQKTVKLLASEKYHNLNGKETRQRSIGGFKKGSGTDRRPFAVGKRERTKDYGGYVCNHRVKMTETVKSDGEKRGTEMKEDEVNVKCEAVASPLQERLTESPVDETITATEEVTENFNRESDRVLSEIMETDAIRSPQARVMTPESPYLLQLSTLLDYITEEKMKYLTKTFHKLDGDKDGHLKFQELESELPRALSEAQKVFIKEVYNVVSSSTFFGLSEFCTVALICEFLLKLPPAPRDAIESSLYTQESISYLMRQFNKSDLRRACAISTQALFGLLQVVEPQRMDRILNDLHLVSIVQIVTTAVFRLSRLRWCCPKPKEILQQARNELVTKQAALILAASD